LELNHLTPLKALGHQLVVGTQNSTISAVEDHPSYQGWKFKKNKEHDMKTLETYETTNPD